MGRIKIFLRSFCLNGCIHRFNHRDSAYNSGIDVSHLATPADEHVSHLVTPADDHLSHRATPADDRVAHLTTPADDIPSHRTTPAEDRLSQAATPQNQPIPPPRELHRSNSPDAAATKLSYDIISVREPLAKILAERQQLLQIQQQRQLIGDHEYIEVYGERGSSCFYEEVAGSITSSATYDQIGAVSNHNYQVLVNAYSVTNPLQISNLNEERDDNTTDQVDGPSNATNEPQSVAIYSVIKKANKQRVPVMRNSVDLQNRECPPRPPPKNLPNHNSQPKIQSIGNKPSTSQNSPVPSTSHGWTQAEPIPSTSYSAINSKILSQIEIESCTLHDKNNSPYISNSRLPQPPPRLSKQPNSYKTTDRPLPSPNKVLMINNNNCNTHDQNKALGIGDDDLESINNGYELLRSNLDDDQIDVGYERIRESNRYSNGSSSSQFCPLQLVDNGGYESVQPIYSSPTITEPNYEAIVPITASELAAAAAAKLNAAASVIEQSK